MQAEAERILEPIHLLQMAVFGYSYRDTSASGKGNPLPTDVGDLAEMYAEIYYGGKFVGKSGHDVLRPCGHTIEVRFRRLYQDKGKQAQIVSDRTLYEKDANTLFYIVYNPVTKKLSGFEFPKGTYERGVSIYWSPAQMAYTKGGSAEYEVELPEPEELFRKKVIYQTDFADERVKNKLAEMTVQDFISFNKFIILGTDGSL
jgi:hypothetical protein